MVALVGKFIHFGRAAVFYQVGMGAARLDKCVVVSPLYRSSI